MTIASGQSDEHMELGLRERKERLGVWRSSSIVHRSTIYHLSVYRQVIYYGWRCSALSRAPGTMPY